MTKITPTMLYVLICAGVHSRRIVGIYTTENAARLDFSKLYESYLPSRPRYSAFDGWHDYFIAKIPLNGECFTGNVDLGADYENDWIALPYEKKTWASKVYAETTPGSEISLPVSCSDCGFVYDPSKGNCPKCD